MTDKLPLLLAIASAALYAVGVAADSALLHFSHNKLEKFLNDEARHQSVAQRLKDFDGYVLSLAIFNRLSITLFIGAFFWWRHQVLPQVAPQGSSVSYLTTFLLAIAFCAVLIGGLVHAVVRQHAERVLLTLFVFVVAVHRALTPLRRPIEAIARLGVGQPELSDEEDAVEEILDAVAEGEAEGTIAEGAAEIIENIMEFKDSTVREVMTPRTSMICVRSDKNIDDAMALVEEHGYSKIPLYGENRDDIVGVVFLKDIMRRRREGNDLKLADLARKAFFVPETKRVHELLKEFQLQKSQIAIVIDEFGGTSGLVTVEDIVEEIVGELEDEFDTSGTPDIDQLGEREFEIDAKVSIDELNDMLELELPQDGDYETVGGFLSARLGKVPEPGEETEYEGVNFAVTEADERRVKRVRVTVSQSVEG
ncbi:MAG: hemolysin family protein [Planctomycetota bacterium]